MVFKPQRAEIINHRTWHVIVPQSNLINHLCKIKGDLHFYLLRFLVLQHSVTSHLTGETTLWTDVFENKKTHHYAQKNWWLDFQYRYKHKYNLQKIKSLASVSISAVSFICSLWSLTTALFSVFEEAGLVWSQFSEPFWSCSSVTTTAVWKGIIQVISLKSFYAFSTSFMVCGYGISTRFLVVFMF